MKGKTRWLALLLAACMLVLCGCGKNAVNKEESQPVVQETAEPVQETEEPVKETAEPAEPETSTEPTEETAPPAEDPAEKAEETAKPDGNTEEPAEPEAGTEAETAAEPEEEEPEASEKPEPSVEPEPSAEPEPGNTAVEEQSAEEANQAEPPVTEEKTEEASVTESPEEEIEPTEAAEAAETAPAEEEPESAPEAEESAPEAEESAPEAEEPEVQRTVEITVPAEYADVRYRIGEVTWNPDDSATYRLTEEEHEQLLEEVRSEIQSELNEMCASPYFLDFYSMTANEDCTVFTVVCLSIETTKAEQKSIPQLYKFGKMYAAYAGREPGNIHIDYMNKIGNTFVTRDSERDEGQASIG